MTGNITHLQTQLGNAANEVVSGVDMAMFYQKEMGSVVTNTTWELSYLDQYDLQTYAGAPLNHELAPLVMMVATQMALKPLF